MTLSDGFKAGAAAALLAVVGGVSYVALTGTSGRMGVWATVLVPAPVHVQFVALAAADDGGNLVVHDGPAGAGYQYDRARVCALPVDGGVDPGPSFFPGLVVVYDDAALTACASSDPTVEAWADTVDGGAPWSCACALPVDAGSCTATVPIRDDGGTQTVPAPTGVTLSAGAWSGSSCRPKTCVELAGFTSWPPECG